MNYTEQVEKPKPQAQQAPSASEKQMPSVVEKIRPWVRQSKPILGIVLSLIGGFAWIWTIVVNQPMVNQPYDPTGIALVGGLLIVILGVVCVVLLSPFRWAIGVVPLVFAFGELVGFFFGVPFQSHVEGYSVVTTYNLALPIGVIAGFILALVGATIGYWINKTRR